MRKTRLHTRLTTAALLALLSGCHKQPKPQPLVPPPMLSPSDMFPVPDALPPADEPAVVTPREPVPTTATAVKPKPRPRNGKKITDLKPATPPPVAETQPTTPETPTAPPKITASPGSVPTNAAISEGLPHSDEVHRKETAAQLNQSTEDNLRSITRALTAAEQSIIAQIRSYISQSQEAISVNDLVRAHNLALKAHLLSDELAHR